MPPQIAVQRRCIDRFPRGNPPRPRDVDLEDIAFADITMDALDGLQVALGRRLVYPRQPRPLPFFSTSHMTGSCRMAEDIDQGVIDASGEVFGYPGMFVSDGAAIPSSLAVNSSLTILAHAERVASLFLARHPNREEPALLVGPAG